MDGVPMGNGYIGAMLWGDGSPLVVNLDHYDIWETRERTFDDAGYNYSNVRTWIRDKAFEKLWDTFPAAPDGTPREACPYVSKLPMPRMELSNAVTFSQARLDVKEAILTTDEWEAFVHAQRHIFVLKGLSSAAFEISIFYPEKDDPRLSPDQLWSQAHWGWAKDCLEGWGYPPLQFGKEGKVCWCKQGSPCGRDYIIAWTTIDDALRFTVVTSLEAGDLLEQAIVNLASHVSHRDLRTEHCDWWHKYWQISDIDLPDKKIENLYYAEMYKLGSCIKPDGRAMPFTGLWTMEGAMPYCWADYHLDLNVQQAYWAVYPSNRLNLGHSLYNTFFDMLPRFRQNCRNFYGIDGASTNCSIGPEGKNVGGWRRMKKHGWQPIGVQPPSMLSWLSHNFWLHYKYSMDKVFLREKAYPMMKASWQVYNHILETGDDGKLHLPVSHSPEFKEGTPDVWQKDTTFEACLVRFLCTSLLECNQILKHDDPDVSRYSDILKNLYDYPGDTEFFYAEHLPQDASHRHPTNLMGVHPLDVTTIEDSPEMEARIKETIRKHILHGSGMWCGHAIAQMLYISSRAQEKNLAWSMLQTYFLQTGVNSLNRHGNARRFAYSSFFDLELTGADTGFSFAGGILEMLLQSWHGIIRIFPAVPDFWADISFRNLLAEGGIEVSARREAGVTSMVELRPRFDGIIRVKNPFDGRAYIDGEEVDDEEIFSIKAQAGSQVTMTPLEKKAPVREGLSTGAHVREGNWFGVKRIPRF